LEIAESFHIRSGKLDPIEWANYARMVSQSSTPLFKYRIAFNLIVLAKLHGNPKSCPPLEKLWGQYDKQEIVGSQQMFAMQSIATTFELTENLAAMCFAYAEAIEHGTKFFPLLLRDFGMSKAIYKYRHLGIDNDHGFEEVVSRHCRYSQRSEKVSGSS
jgi:hypothetical protein